MKLKKLLCLTLAGIMTFSLAACGSKGGDDKAEDGKTVKVAVVETAYGAPMWEKVVDAFEASHEGVTVELTIDKKLEDVITPDMKAETIQTLSCVQLVLNRL